MTENKKLKNNIDPIYFEQYKILVNSYESLQSKRANINNFLVILYTSIISLYSFIHRTKSSSLTDAISIYSLAIFISIVWVGTILKSIQTEKIKYKMIQKIEDDMPIRVFTKSHNDNYLFNSKTLSTSAIELLLPAVLLILFSVNMYISIH